MLVRFLWIPEDTRVVEGSDRFPGRRVAGGTW